MTFNNYQLDIFLKNKSVGLSAIANRLPFVTSGGFSSSATALAQEKRIVYGINRM